MAQSSLARHRQKLADRLAAGRRASKSRQERNMLLRRGGVAAGGVLLGMLPRMGAPVAVFGVPTKVAVGAAAFAIESFTSGKTQAFASGVVDASLATYAERATSTGSLVAGMGDGATAYLSADAHDV